MKIKKGDANLNKALRFKEAIGQLGHSSITVTEKHYAKYIKGEHKGWVRTTLE